MLSSMRAHKLTTSGLLRNTGLGLRAAGVSPARIVPVRTLFPAPPEVIKGTVNDPVTYPPPNKLHGSWHWDFERLVSASLVPLTLTPIFTGSGLHPVTDALFTSLLIVHSHIGFQACVEDYFPYYRFPRLGHVMMWILRGATVATLVGMYSFNTNDVGLTEAIRRVWTA